MGQKLFYPIIISSSKDSSFFPVRNMRKVSVASVPRILKTPDGKQEEEIVCCLGQTAKLQARSGFFDDERRVSDSFKCLTSFVCA